MKRAFAGLLLAGATAIFGCNPSTPGGPGATAPTITDNTATTPPVTYEPGTTTHTTNKPVIGQAEETFSLNAPALGTSLKQGEARAISISISRGTNFDQDVEIRFANLPQGVTFDPESQTLKAGEDEVKLMVKAADDAALGDFTINVTGTPATGRDANTEFRLTIREK